MVRLALCCQFIEEPIKFRTTTAAAMHRLSRKQQRQRLAELCRHNADAVLASLQYCREHGIGGFRINSQILPLKTHPDVGYQMQELPGHERIISRFVEAGDFARQHDIRTTFHPDQFILLNSPRPEVVRSSLAELRYHAEVADWVGADVINIHGGGAYGDKTAALKRLARKIKQLPRAIRNRITLENDDKIFSPADLLPICRETNVPLVYDVHHHRCLQDELDVEEATKLACETWNREPLFHISSPIDGWNTDKPNRHADLIDLRDFPPCWEPLTITVEVEAKGKEVAVTRLLTGLKRRDRRRLKQDPS